MAGEFPHWRNTCDHQRPTCMSGFLDRNYVYGTHILTDASDALAYRWHRPTGALQTVLCSTLVGNALDLPVYLPDDAHYGLLTAVDSLDGVHIIGNSQVANSPPGRPGSPTTVMHHIVCTNVNAFTNPASWVLGDEPMAGTDTSTGKTYTYHWMDRLSNGDLIWFATQVNDSTENAGRDNVAWATNGGRTFTRPLASLTGVAATAGVFYECPDDGSGGGTDTWYWQAILVQPGAGAGGSDRIHITGLERPDWTAYSSETKPLYAYMDMNAVGSWFAGDGTALSMPLTPTNSAAAIIPGTSGTGVHGWDYLSATAAGGVTMCYDNGATAGVGGTLTEYTITAGAWTSAALPNISGDMVRKYKLIMPNGATGAWYSSVSGSQRVLLTRSNLSQVVRFGPSVRFTALPGSQYAATFAIGPDPIVLREEGCLLCNIGDGNNIRMCCFPDSNGYRGP